MNKIKGGYYLKARCIQNSDISVAPPYVREIWDWLLKEANHRDNKWGNKVIKRGQLFRTYQDIRDGLAWKVGYRLCRYNENHTKKAMKYLRKHLMIDTTKELGGVLITICNYDFYQDPKNYDRTNERTNERTTKEPRENHPIPDINNNDKNKKNYKKESEEKLKFHDEVFLTQKEYDRLIEDYGEKLILIKIEDADEWLSQGNNRTKRTDHNKMIRNWLRRDGYEKIVKIKEQPEEPEKEISEPEWAKKLKLFKESCPEYFKELEESINDTSLETWFMPLKFVSETDKLITLYASKGYIVSWITEHYSELLKEIFKKDFVIKTRKE